MYVNPATYGHHLRKSYFFHFCSFYCKNSQYSLRLVCFYFKTHGDFKILKCLSLETR
jgi:hypothetical protein